MGATESVAIDRTLLDNMLQETRILESGLQAAVARNCVLTHQLEESDTNRTYLQRKLKEMSESHLEQQILEQKVSTLERENETLYKKYENCQMVIKQWESTGKTLRQELDQVTQEVKVTQSKYEENNKMWNRKYSRLTSQHSTLQSELNLYKSNRSVAQLVELQQLLQKLATQIDTARTKMNKETRNQKRKTGETELEIMNRVCGQNVKTSTLHNEKLNKNKEFLTTLARYKNLCEQNDQSISNGMELIRAASNERKVLYKNLNTQTFETTEKVKASAERYLKEITDLKQKSFTDNFKEEEKLYRDLTRAFDEIKTMSKSIPNNLNIPLTGGKKISNLLSDNSASLEGISMRSAKKTNTKTGKEEDLPKNTPSGWTLNNLDKDDKSFSVIMHNFPENQLSGVNSDTMDVINIRFLLAKLDLNDLENITAQRLPIPNNRNIRPVIMTLPNSQAFSKILHCTKELAKMGLQNVQISAFYGKM